MSKKDTKSETIPGFIRLVDFIKSQAKAQQKKKDPDSQMRKKAIAAYKKVRAS